MAESRTNLKNFELVENKQDIETSSSPYSPEFSDLNQLKSKDKQVEPTPRQKKKMTSYIALVPLNLLMILFLSISILLVLMFDQYFDAANGHMFNTFCEDLNKGSTSIGSLDYEVCHHSEKKNSFIWLHLDGLSFDQIKPFIQATKNDTLIFKSIGPSYRQSGAMHESHFTGQSSRNFIGNPIQMDNIAKQMRKAEGLLPVQLTGTAFPLKTEIGDEMSSKKIYLNEDGFFRGMCAGENLETSLYFEHLVKFENYPRDIFEMGVFFDHAEFQEALETAYPQFDTNTTRFDSELRQCLLSSQLTDPEFQYFEKSTIYYTTLPDRLNHGYSKGHAYNMFAIFRINKFLIQLVDFYERYFPDTAVFISSDHGGQYFNGEDNFCNHGCTSDSNQGILVVHLPNRKGQGRVDELQYIDIAPTIAQYLTNVNVPIQSKGKAIPLEKGVFKWEILALHLRYVQQKNFFAKYELQISENKIESNDSINNSSSPNNDESLSTEDIANCLTLSEKYSDVLIREANGEVSSQEQSEILQQYSTCITQMDKKMREVEISLKDKRIVIVLQCILTAAIIYVILVNLPKAIRFMRSNAAICSNLNRIVLAIAIALLFSDNIFLILVGDTHSKNGEMNFYRDSFLAFFGLLILLLCVFVALLPSSSHSLQKLSSNVLPSIINDAQTIITITPSLSSELESQSFSPTKQSSQKFGHISNENFQKNTNPILMPENNENDNFNDIGEDNNLSIVIKTKSDALKGPSDGMGQSNSLIQKVQSALNSLISANVCVCYFIILILVCEYLISNNTFVFAKQDYMESLTKKNYLTFFNYVAFASVYFYPRMRQLRMHKIQISYYAIIYLIMLTYDFIDFRYLIRKTFWEVLVTRITTLAIALSYLYNVIYAYKLILKERTQRSKDTIKEEQINSDSSNNSQYKGGQMSIASEYFMRVMIDIALFLFYLGDDIERFFLVVLYLPTSFMAEKLLEIFTVYRKREMQQQQTSVSNKKANVTSLNSFVAKVLVFAMFFKSLQVIYSAFKGTLSLDVNISSGNKTIGEYQDQTPLYTGALFGINKMIVFMFGFIDVSIIFLRINPKSSLLQLDEKSLTFVGVIVLKQLICSLQILSSLFSDESFFGLFMWCCAIAGVFSVQLLVPYVVIRGFDAFQQTIRYVLKSALNCLYKIVRIIK